VDAAMIERMAGRLRAARADMVALYGLRGVQARAVYAICDVADMWRDSQCPQRRRAEREPGAFPFEMVRVSFDPLVASLNRRTLTDLIDSERPDLTAAPGLIGHVVAGNTPLLAWTTVIRALLVGSASLVKLPSGPSSVWYGYFADTLKEASPEIASLIDGAAWRGGDAALDGALYRSVDKIVAYGSDETLAAIVASAAPTAVLRYGHKVSIAVVTSDSDWAVAADGLATDILLYDQGGCLSPQTVFVEGGYEDAVRLGGMLADFLARSMFVDMLPLSPNRSARVYEARQMARFEERCALYEDDRARWTVIVRPESRFYASPTHAVVAVVPIDIEKLHEILKPYGNIFQGAAVSCGMGESYAQLCVQLAKIGVCYTCRPGMLQSPTISWRENGLDVLSSMLF
jgi:hypothetical protein